MTTTLELHRDGAEVLKGLCRIASSERARAVLTTVAFYPDQVVATDSFVALSLPYKYLNGKALGLLGFHGSRGRVDVLYYEEVVGAVMPKIVNWTAKARAEREAAA